MVQRPVRNTLLPSVKEATAKPSPKERKKAAKPSPKKPPPKEAAPKEEAAPEAPKDPALEVQHLLRNGARENGGVGSCLGYGFSFKD
jgi:hypothetical protein